METMISFKQLAKPATLQEAWELNQKKTSVIVGGMLWLKMQERTFQTAIDLSGLGLEKIEETETEWKIGAMVTLSQLEHHEGLNAMYQGSLKKAVEKIVGVQFRNMATVGGSVFGRYGFSDVLTVLMALDGQAELVGSGRISLEEFADRLPDRDVLAWIVIPKSGQKVHYQSIRNQATDFPVLTCAVAKTCHGFQAVIGARPQKAMVIHLEDSLDVSDPKAIDAAAAYVREMTPTAGNQRAGKEYRSRMAEVLTRRGLKALGEKYDN